MKLIVNEKTDIVKNLGSMNNGDGFYLVESEGDSYGIVVNHCGLFTTVVTFSKIDNSADIRDLSNNIEVVLCNVDVTFRKV